MVRAVRKKIWKVHDEDSGKTLDIWVQQVGRKISGEYHAILARLEEARKTEDHGSIMAALGELLLLRVCDESRKDFEYLFEGIPENSYAEALNEINTLFGERAVEEKKEISQSSTESSSSASAESTSTPRESSTPENASPSNSGVILEESREPATSVPG